METQSAIPVTSGAHGASVTHMDAIHNLPLPPWLQDPQQPTQLDPVPSPSRNGRVLAHTVYASLFESALERIMGGTPLATIVASDPRGIQLGRFLFWINRDETRKARYEEACLIAAETMAHELTAIADALPLDGSNPSTILMEDVQRSALRMKARTYLMERWSPQRYGDSKRIQIDSTSLTASVTADDLTRMSLAELRTMAARVFARATERDDTIDVTPTPADAADTPLDEAA